MTQNFHRVCREFFLNIQKQKCLVTVKASTGASGDWLSKVWWTQLFPSHCWLVNLDPTPYTLIVEIVVSTSYWEVWCSSSDQQRSLSALSLASLQWKFALYASRFWLSVWSLVIFLSVCSSWQLVILLQLHKKKYMKLKYKWRYILISRVPLRSGWPCSVFVFATYSFL